MNPAQSTSSWDGKGKGSALGYRIFIALIGRLGVLPAYVLVLPACLRYVFFDKASRSALKQFRARLGLGRYPGSLLPHFYAFGISLVDRFAFLLLKRPPFRYRYCFEQRIQDALGQGNGAILLGAHLGNWEIAGNLLHDRLSTPLHALMVDNERQALRQASHSALSRRRINIVPLVADSPDTVLQLLQALRRNELVAMLGDRVFDGKSENIDFLGSPAPFPSGPFALAAASGAPIVPVSVIKQGVRTYCFSAYEPIRLAQLPRSQRRAALLEAMQSYAHILEQQCRTHPYQWFNFFPFWPTA
jgi:predicted LPLAT superfamily acyltransferase